MRIEFDIDNRTCTVHRDGGPKVYRDSTLLHQVKQELIAQGYSVIKKRAAKDGHLVDDDLHYIRARDHTWAMWHADHQIESACESYNQEGKVTLVLEGVPVQGELKSKLLDALEAKIDHEHGPFDWDLYKSQVPRPWKRWPWCYLGYGPRNGDCVNIRGPFFDEEDVRGSILEMFSALFLAVIESRPILEPLANIQVLVMPSHKDWTHVAVLDLREEALLYHNRWEAWCFTFETPQELDRFMAQVAAKITARKTAQRAER